MNAPPSLALLPIRSWTGFHRARITCLSFNTDGALIASGDTSGRINLFRVSDGHFLGALQLEAGVEPAVCTWQTSERLWLACSDGKVLVLSILDKANPTVVDFLPSQFPEAPTGLYLRTFKNVCKACVYYAGTVELWIQRRGSWHGVGCSLSPSDVVLSAVPVAEDEVLIVYRDEGMSLWSIPHGVRREVAGWRKGFVADFWAVVPVPGLRNDPMSPACVAHVVAVNNSTLQSFGLFGDPFRHLYTVVETSRPSWLGGPCDFTLWGNVPTLLARSKSTIVAVDLLNSTYPAANSTALVNRISQLISLPNDQLSLTVLTAFSGQDGRHVAAARGGCNGSEVTLWSASASGCGPAVRTADEFKGKAPIVRVHDELLRHIRSKRLAATRRWICFFLAAFSLSLAILHGWILSFGRDLVVRYNDQAWPSAEKIPNDSGETMIKHPATRMDLPDSYNDRARPSVGELSNDLCVAKVEHASTGMELLDVRADTREVGWPVHFI